MIEILQEHKRWVVHIVKHQGVKSDEQLAEGLYTTVASIRLLRRKYGIARPAVPR